MADTIEVGFVLPAETARQLVAIEAVEDLLAGAVAYLGGKLSDDQVLALFKALMRRVDVMSGYEGVQHGRAVWAYREGE